MQFPLEKKGEKSGGRWQLNCWYVVYCGDSKADWSL